MVRYKVTTKLSGLFLFVKIVSKVFLKHGVKFEIYLSRFVYHVLYTNTEFGHFMWLFRRGRKRNVTRFFFMHVKSHCSANLTFA